ncbi:MAG TPA: EI24 domain-containing protein [Rhizomicrobium sp.]|jgi:CysZ protein|nr:EI24 domain-containing protein [Rhizomicrobium sp.]
MFASARKALAVIFDPAFSGIAARAIFLTIALFVVLFLGMEYVIHHLPTLGWHWVNRALALLAPIMFVFLIFFLGAPVAALFASFYLDRVADAVEARFYPKDGKAPGTPFLTALRAGARLAGLLVLVNLALLPFDTIPLVGEGTALIINGWLLGREYFELAALRHLPQPAVDALRKSHRFGVFFAGLLISVLSIVPIANLFAPLYGSAFMVHLFKRYQERSA